MAVEMTIELATSTSNQTLYNGEVLQENKIVLTPNESEPATIVGKLREKLGDTFALWVNPEYKPVEERKAIEAAQRIKENAQWGKIPLLHYHQPLGEALEESRESYGSHQVEKMTTSLEIDRNGRIKKVQQVIDIYSKRSGGIDTVIEIYGGEERKDYDPVYDRYKELIAQKLTTAVN